MYKSLNTIRSKFLALLLTIGALVGIFLLIFYLNINEVSTSLRHYQQLYSLQQQLNQLIDLENQYLRSGFIDDENLNKNKVEKIEETRKQFIEGFQVYYQGISRYKNYFDSIESLVLTRSDIFTEITRNKLDKGGLNEGLTAEFLSSYYLFIQSLTETGNLELIGLIPEIEKYTYIFLLSAGVDAGMEYIQFINNLPVDQADFLFVPSAADSASVDVDIAPLEEATLQLARKFELLGTSPEGLTNKLHNNASALNTQFTNFNDEISNVLLRTVTGSRFLIYLFIILVLGILIVIFKVLKKYVFLPLGLYHNFFIQLSKGIIPEKYGTTANDEFAQIGQKFNDFTSDLSKKIEFTKNIDSGNYDHIYQPLSEEDTLGLTLLELRGDLKKSANEEAKFKEEEMIRSWTNEGLASMNEILRKNQNGIQSLSDQIIQNLVNYLDANQGGIFLFKRDQEKKETLELVSFFAYNRKKYVNKEILMGEGLVGTCAVEKQTTYIEDVPEDYIAVTSGLGEARPRALLLVPLKIEEELRGVLEIASFKPFKPHEIEFLEKMGEGIASTIATVEINEQTNYLLEQSRIQAEEMSHQEEEMRQNMEELQATQEEASRKEAEFASIMQAMNKSLYHIEFNKEGKIIYINQKFKELAGISSQNIIGQRYEEIFHYSSDENKTNADYWKLFQRETTQITGYVEFDDNETCLQQTYTPVKDEAGIVNKIICLAMEVLKHEAPKDNE